MGVKPNVAHDKYPKQTRNVNQRCLVCFHSDPSVRFEGTIVRDDAEEPAETIIELDDGRFVRSDECMYSPTVPSRALSVRRPLTLLRRRT